MNKNGSNFSFPIGTLFWLYEVAFFLKLGEMSSILALIMMYVTGFHRSLYQIVELSIYSYIAKSFPMNGCCILSIFSPSIEIIACFFTFYVYVQTSKIIFVQDLFLYKNSCRIY